MVYKRPIKDEFELAEENEEALDFEQMLDESFHLSRRRLNVGDKIRAEVLSVGRENVIVNTGTLSDGFVPTASLLGEDQQPRVKVGDSLELYVVALKAGQAILSPNPGEKNLADNLVEAFQNRLTVEGKVLSANKGGFTVNVLGKDAFCPVSQIDVKFVEKTEDYVGRRFEFMITQLDARNVVVSRRRVLEAEQGRALERFATERKVGDVLSGTVSRLEKFGAFVEIAPGIEGLAHISELSWTRVKDPSEVLEVGAPVSAKILRMEHDGPRLKISLSLKQSENEPWTNLPVSITAGALISGKVTRCLNFGAFVEVAPGIEGLIPLSEMSATKKVNRSDEVVKAGERVNVVVKDVNIQSKRLALSLKAAGEIPSSEETQDLKDFQVKQSKSATGANFGTLASKLQAALNKNQKS